MTNQTGAMPGNIAGSSQDDESLFTSLSFLLNRFGVDFSKCLPAIVSSYDRTNNWATVQPAIHLVDVNNNAIERKQIAQVPVLSLGGGGFHVNFPIKNGDLGWIFATDRDITLYKQQLTATKPNSKRTHRWEDGLFIPDVMRRYTIASEDSSAMVIQSTDGQNKVSIGEGQIIIQATSKVLVRVPLAEFTQDVQIDGNLLVEGGTTVNGGFDASGSGSTHVTLPSNTKVNGKPVDGHNHGGADSKGDTINPF